jgi:hypothetical protein
VDIEYRIFEYSKMIEFRIRIICKFSMTNVFSNKTSFIRKLFDKFENQAHSHCYDLRFIYIPQQHQPSQCFSLQGVSWKVRWRKDTAIGHCREDVQTSVLIYDIHMYVNGVWGKQNATRAAADPPSSILIGRSDLTRFRYFAFLAYSALCLIGGGIILCGDVV